MKKSLLLILLWFIGSSTAPGQKIPLCEIHGRVLDPTGNPVEGASVHVNPIDHSPGSRLEAFIPTQKEGVFSIGNLTPGTYRVHAVWDKEGYADSLFSFHDTGLSPIVEVSATNPLANTTVVLGRKAGIVTGNIVNAATGALIPHATFHMWRIKAPASSIYTSAGSPYRLLIPSDIEVGIEVHAVGFQTWHYSVPGTLGQAASVLLKPAEVLNIDVMLLLGSQ